MAKRRKVKAAPQPEPMVFERAPAPKTEYERISERVLAAIQEVNSAIKEAHECAEMRVFLATRPKDADGPMSFEPQIYRLTHSTLTFKVQIKEQEPRMEWRAVKDPAFKDAAGQAFAAFRKKAA